MLLKLKLCTTKAEAAAQWLELELKAVSPTPPSKSVGMKPQFAKNGMMSDTYERFSHNIW